MKALFGDKKKAANLIEDRSFDNVDGKINCLK